MLLISSHFTWLTIGKCDWHLSKRTDSQIASVLSRRPSYRYASVSIGKKSRICDNICLCEKGVIHAHDRYKTSLGKGISCRLVTDAMEKKKEKEIKREGKNEKARDGMIEYHPLKKSGKDIG